jgi:hypothetical protein
MHLLVLDESVRGKSVIDGPKSLMFERDMDVDVFGIKNKGEGGRAGSFFRVSMKMQNK